eukprot:gene11471-13373_t
MASSRSTNSKSVFVGNIPYDASEKELVDIFSEVGRVVSFRLVEDRDTKKPKGYGFCEYLDQETALSAIRNLNNREFSKRTLRVSYADNEKANELASAMGIGIVSSPPDPRGGPGGPGWRDDENANVSQLFDMLAKMKLMVQQNPEAARAMLVNSPQLSLALLHAQVVVGMVGQNTAQQIIAMNPKNQPFLQQPSSPNFQPMPNVPGGPMSQMNMGGGGPILGPNGPIGGNMGPGNMGPGNMGPGGPMNMGPGNMGPMGGNMGPGNMGPGNMGPGGPMNMGPGGMQGGPMGPGNMGPGNMGPMNMGPGGPMNMGPGGMQGGPNMGGNMGPGNMGPGGPDMNMNMRGNMGPGNMGPGGMQGGPMGPGNMGPGNMGPGNMGPGGPNMGPRQGGMQGGPNMGPGNMGPGGMQGGHMGPGNMGPGGPNMGPRQGGPGGMQGGPNMGPGNMGPGGMQGGPGNMGPGGPQMGGGPMGGQQGGNIPPPPNISPMAMANWNQLTPQQRQFVHYVLNLTEQQFNTEIPPANRDKVGNLIQLYRSQ